MKRALFFIVSLFILTFLSCDQNKNYLGLGQSNGKSGEVLVVIDSFPWSGAVGDEIRQALMTEQEGLPQSEPYFHVMNVQHKSFSRFLNSHRNIIYYKKNTEQKQANLSFKRNVWAKNQVVVNIEAPSDEDAAQELAKYVNEIRELFRNEENDRLTSHLKKQPQAFSKEKWQQRGYKVILPDVFKVAKESEKVIWFRRDQQIGEHTVTQGVLVYDIPANSNLASIKWLVDNRDSVTQAFVNGPSDSYMKVYREYQPVYRLLAKDNADLHEFRGLWNMEGAFMGGPFVNYALFDEKNNRYICADVFVFAPKFDKREYLRELEAIGQSLTLLP